MNLDELQSVQARERQSSDLQHLRSSFYREVGEFINGLIEERAEVVEAADDPFSEPEVRRITDDIETAEGTVEAIYERRVGKVVKKASIAAAGMPIEDEGLTSEEEALFEDLVDRIEENRETVLSVLDGESPTVSCSIDEESSVERTDASPTDRTVDTEPSPEPARESPEGVSAADLMADGADTAAEVPSGEDQSNAPPTPDPDSGPSPGSEPEETDSPRTPPAGPEVEGGDRDRDRDGGRPSVSEASSGETERDASGASDASSRSSSEREGSDIPGIPRTTVRITADVGEIVGADDRDYDLGAEDVVTLPEPNAEVLVEKDAAERLG